MAHTLNLHLERHAEVPVSTDPAGELLSCRSKVCIHEENTRSGLLSVFDFLFEKSYHLRPENDEIKCLYAYHNPTVQLMTMAFLPIAGASYAIKVHHAVLPNASVEMRTSAELLIPSLAAGASLEGNGYTVSNGTVLFAFDTHFGSKMIVTVTASLGGKVVCEEVQTVQAPHGDLFLPVPVFAEPFNYKNDFTPNLLTFSAEGSYKVKRFHSTAAVQDLAMAFYDGSVLAARYYRLHFHRDLPMLHHMKVADLPLVEFVQKLTMQYPVGEGYHYYLDEERPCIEQMGTYEDILVLVSTENAEFRRWMHIAPNLSKEAGEQAILDILRSRYPAAHDLLEAVEILGYSGEDGCEVMLLSTQADPKVCLQVIGGAAGYDSVCSVTATESTPLKDILSDAEGCLLLSNAQKKPIFDLTLTCKEAGITWSSSFAFSLASDDFYSLAFGGDADQKHFYSAIKDIAWNSLWSVDKAAAAVVKKGTHKVHVSHNGSTLTIAAAPGLPVFWLKYHLQGLTGVSVGQQRLLLHAHQLEDRGTLAAQNVSDGAQLELVVRVRGNPTRR